MPRQTATLPRLLLTSFATIATAIAYADASVARVELLRAVIVRMLLLHIKKSVNCCPDAPTATAMLPLLLRYRVLPQLLLRTRYRYCAYQETLLR